MISQELQAQMKKVKIIAKRLMKTSIVGDYLSAFKGMGMEFHQLRAYEPGDDVRSISWNSFAKTQNLMVKEFVQERDRTIILMIDISASAGYSSKEDLRGNVALQLASVLAFVANENQDRVGALFFSDKVEKWIPPSRKSSNVSAIIENLLALKPSSKGTNISEALRFLADMKVRSSIVFMVSDWIDSLDSYSKLLHITACKHDFVAVRLLDDCEKSFPDIGLIDICDPESGEIATLKTGKQLNKDLNDRILQQEKVFRSYKIDLLDLKVGHSFIDDLIKFLHRRIRRSV